MNIYRQRAQNLIRALRESPDPAGFTMGCWARPCGTPACVLGHYAARSDLQDVFQFRRDRFGFLVVAHVVDGTSITPMDNYSKELLGHFGLMEDEAFELFSTRGCGSARTPEQAIAYIQSFMDKKWPAPPAQKFIEKLNRIEAPAKEAEAA